MPVTCQSEYLPLTEVMLNPVRSAFQNPNKISQEWKALHYLSAPQWEKALKEFDAFEGLLRQEGIRIQEFPKSPDLSLDALYCRDASITTDHGIILCNMGKPARSPEPEAMHNYFVESGISILGSIKAPGTLEGGDVAWLDTKTLAVGLGYRTNLEGIRQLKKLLKPYEIEVVVADLPHYRGPSDVFHLMSILSPVDKDLLVTYSPLMPIRFRNYLLDRGFSLVEVPEAEFDSMGCNVLALSPRKCLMVQGNPITEERLKQVGCTVLTYSGEEISVKGGGGPTCLTRPLSRTFK
ncbi:MAG: hypothetical protein KJP14_03330 [Eudoraea sp.]|nr:hypothetical protein [Eudoraea sp.]